MTLITVMYAYKIPHEDMKKNIARALK
jgi:hypothetical protein